MINLECQGYSDSYDLQNTGTAVCFESGDIALRYIGIDKQGSGNYWEVESYITDASGGADITMDNTYFKILAIAERSS